MFGLICFFAMVVGLVIFISELESIKRKQREEEEARFWKSLDVAAEKAVIKWEVACTTVDINKVLE